MDSKSRFKAVRKHYQLTMCSFGKKIGLSASGVSAIECGARAMNEKHIKLIHSAFPDISEEWLRSGEGDMIAIHTDNAAKDSSIINKILCAYCSLSPESQAAFIRYLDFLVAEESRAAEAAAVDPAQSNLG